MELPEQNYKTNPIARQLDGQVKISCNLTHFQHLEQSLVLKKP